MTLVVFLPCLKWIVFVGKKVIVSNFFNVITYLSFIHFLLIDFDTILKAKLWIYIFCFDRNSNCFPVSLNTCICCKNEVEISFYRKLSTIFQKPHVKKNFVWKWTEKYWKKILDRKNQKFCPITIFVNWFTSCKTCQKCCQILTFQKLLYFVQYFE